MNASFRLLFGLLACLISSRPALAQRYYSQEIKLGEAASTTHVSVDTVSVNIFLTGMVADKEANVTITESGTSPRTETLPADLFGKRAVFPTAGTTEAVRITLTPDGYGVGLAADSPNSTDPSKSTLLQPHPWKLPVTVTVKYDKKNFTLTIFKAYPYTGSVLLDAARIDSLITDKNPDLYKLLKEYDPKMPAPATTTKAALTTYFGDEIAIQLSGKNAAGRRDTLNEKVKRNPYLADLIKNLDPTFPEPNAGLVVNSLTAESEASATKGAGTSFGALGNPMLAADALATFIARRFKEEVNIAFLNEFREKLKIDSTLGIVFPETKSTMLAIDPYQYTTFMESMKTAFEADLKLLPTHSAQLLDTLVARKRIRFAPDRVVVSRVTLQTLQRTLDNRNDYWGALRDIGPGSLTGSSDTLRSVLLTGSVLLNSVLDAANQVRLPRVAAARQKDYTNRVLGLLLARYDTTLLGIQTKIAPANSLDKANFLAYALHTQTGSYASLTAASASLGQALQAFDRSLKTLRDKAKKEADKEDAPQGFGTTVIVGGDAKKPTKLLTYTDFALKLTTTLDRMLAAETVFKSLPAARIRQRVLKPVQDGIMAFRYVQEKEYALAVIYTANLLVALTSRNDSTDSRTTAALKKYGMFMTSVVAAETRDQMLTALETAALPVGSYRIKRNNFFSVAINTYGGVATGWENVREISSVVSGSAVAGTTKSGFLLAPYAPLGISFAWGRNADYVNRKDHGSFGFHLNLLDVGALAAVRIDDENVSLPEFTWQNLLAPGAQVMWGLPKSVFTVAVGAQFGPELRRVNLDQGKNIIDTRQWRIGATISADIPVFNVFTQANRRKLETLQKSTLNVEAGKSGKDYDAPFVVTEDEIAKQEKRLKRKEAKVAKAKRKLDELKAKKAEAATK
jgi:hypothetical protein